MRSSHILSCSKSPATLKGGYKMPNRNVDYFARRPARRPSTNISPFELNNEGNGQALVLRYARCNLKCPLCYAWRYAWFMRNGYQNGYQYNIQQCIRALNNLPRLAEKKIVWVRIQGGEPCLTFNRILNTLTFAVESLKVIHTNGLNRFSNTRAVIQTNAITFSKLSHTQINQIQKHLQRLLLNDLTKGRLIFEVSFKSPNDPQYLNSQSKGYEILLKQIIMPLWHQGFDNIAVYPLAGLGPSIDQNNLFIIPIDPNKLSDEIPLFHRRTWVPQFENLVNDFTNNIVPNYSAYNDFKRNPLTTGGKKVAIEELEPTPFQTSWISGYANGYNNYGVNVMPINRILRKLTNNVPQNPQWYKWYNSWISRMLFGRSQSWMNVFSSIPAANNPRNLLSMVRQMNGYFYPSHPIRHYRYL